MVSTDAEGNRTETPAGESDLRRYMVEGSCSSLLLDMKEASIKTGGENGSLRWLHQTAFIFVFMWVVPIALEMDAEEAIMNCGG